MKKNLLILFVLFALNIFAASGDVTVVTSHTGTQLTWYGGYSEMTSFPDETGEYQQILMDFTLGCSTGGCSHWDYTVRIEIGEYTGAMDSSVASYDTISTMPLVLDTNWNEAFQVVEWYELGRMITPYGNYMDYAWGGNDNGFDGAWNKTWTYDVTMMEPLLHGDVPVRMFFSGWPQNGRGFSGDLEFRYIEGFPTRRVSNIQKVYNGGTYLVSAQFEQDVVPAKNLTVSSSKADLRMIITGHGQDGEFTPIKYRTFSDNTLLREEDLWRNDCSENTLSPQGGTWILNRANWCPGDDVEEHWFDLSSHIDNGSINVDVNFDSYLPDTGQASYIISGYLFEYEEINRLYDATIDEIVTPSNSGERHNISSTTTTVAFNRSVATICTNPIVRIKNLGRNDLTYCQIDYGVIGGDVFYYEWTGNLKYGETEEVTLPILNWNDLDASNPEFFAKTSYPNRLVDQFQSNDRKQTGFELPPVFNAGNLTFRMRTNNRPNENSYTLKDLNGTEIINESSFASNSTNDENVVLTNGCYKLEVLDVDDYFFQNEIGGDGLSWWVNLNNGLESAGYFEVRATSPSARLAYFNPDFGHKIEYDFMVGEALNEQFNPPLTPDAPTQAVVEEVVVDGETYFYMPSEGLYFSEVNVDSDLESVLSIKNNNELDKNINVFPNPTTDNVNIFFTSTKSGNANLVIQDAQGRVINKETIQLNQNHEYNFDGKAKGLYFFTIDFGGKKTTKKVTIL